MLEAARLRDGNCYATFLFRPGDEVILHDGRLGMIVDGDCEWENGGARERYYVGLDNVDVLEVDWAGIAHVVPPEAPTGHQTGRVMLRRIPSMKCVESDS